ncbi:MAG: ankyrin repeat domain-containing protein [Lentisphaeria bacterium]|nr:ankyrin repeat domain-containing protein [Lentisphaeria bacterium]NQZ66485.1 ankyrin repeat domain-containing protein [Lentisphaeria bacterium]
MINKLVVFAFLCLVNLLVAEEIDLESSEYSKYIKGQLTDECKAFIKKHPKFITSFPVLARSEKKSFRCLLQNVAGETRLKLGDLKYVLALKPDLDVKTSDKDGKTALYIAVESHSKDKKDVIKLLLEAGANPNIKSNNSDKTAFERLTVFYKKPDDRYEMIALFFKHGFDPNTYNQNYGKQVAQTYFGNDKNLKMANLFIDNPRFKIDLREKNGNSYLHRAAGKNAIKIMKLLIKNKASIDALNKRKETPLYEAVEMSHFEAVELLLNNNANPNIRSKSGDHVLNETKDEDIRELLIKHGAVDKKSIKKKEPIKPFKPQLEVRVFQPNTLEASLLVSYNFAHIKAEEIKNLTLTRLSGKKWEKRVGLKIKSKKGKYLDTKLGAGKTYRYELKLETLEQTYTERSISITAHILKTPRIKPQKPTNLKLIPVLNKKGDFDIKVTWELANKLTKNDWYCVRKVSPRRKYRFSWDNPNNDKSAINATSAIVEGYLFKSGEVKIKVVGRLNSYYYDEVEETITVPQHYFAPLSINDLTTSRKQSKIKIYFYDYDFTGIVNVKFLINDRVMEIKDFKTITKEMSCWTGKLVAGKNYKIKTQLTDIFGRKKESRERKIELLVPRRNTSN